MILNSSVGIGFGDLKKEKIKRKKEHFRIVKIYQNSRFKIMT